MDTIAYAAPDPNAFGLVEWGAIGVSYLLGAVPFGLLLTRGLGGVDLRTVGSGNIGATNAMRVLGRGWGVVSFLLDFGKGWLPVFVLAPAAASAADPAALQVASGAAAVLGHCYPVYLGFKGGKGVATASGAVFGLDPLVGLIAAAVWVIALYTFKFVGVASILMGIAFPVAAWSLHRSQPVLVGGAGFLTLLIILRHRSNIARMLAGKEPRIGPHNKIEPPSESSHG